VNFTINRVANEWASDITLVLKACQKNPDTDKQFSCATSHNTCTLCSGASTARARKEVFFVLIYPELSNLGLSKECLTYRYM